METASSLSSGRAPRTPHFGGLPVRDGIYSLPALRLFPDLLHGISTRTSPQGSDWNLSAKRGTPEHPANPDVAMSNRETLAARLGIRLEHTVGCRQVHGTDVSLVGEAQGGAGMFPDRLPIEGVDALVTATPGLYLMVLAADCPPVFFYDPVRRAIGLAHSGWKGTVGRISAHVVESMTAHWRSDPADIVAVVGPGIGACCYKVGSNVVEAVEESFPRAWTQAPAILELYDGSIYFNLAQAIRRTLLDAGLKSANVSLDGTCTMHNTAHFYSHRGEAGKCGLFGAVLGMRHAD
ncbi:MAG: peptidoglycan editing factor PgeF [Chloroflexota bacterium]|nr:peptidoglycan editing factor PgeF [Chloroflexota bacterium]